MNNIDNKKEYNKCLASKKHSQFLNSWEWGEFQKEYGHKIFRLQINKTNVVTLLKKTPMRGFAYFYCQLQIDDLSDSELNSLFKEIEQLAQKEKVIFLRLDIAGNKEIKNIDYKLVKTINIQPAQSIIIDLKQEEDEILKNMHQKTRYNIRLANKKGVAIEDGKTEEVFNEFWKLMQETGNRDGFNLHNREYYQKMLTIKSNANLLNELNIKLFLAKYEDKVLATGIFAFFGDTATYLHGASSNKLRNLMAPYALQWHAIKKAKEMGCHYYDFYGIDKAKWPGVTRFKEGFGGDKINNAGTFDLIFNQKYYRFYMFLRKLRRLM